MQCYFSCMDILILSQQQMNISHLLPPFQGIALMPTWTAWMHATRPWSTRWMAGAVLLQTLWTLLALKFHCVDPTLMFVFRKKTHEFFVFNSMFNRFNSGFMLIYFLGWNFSWFIMRILEALFCQVQKTHRTKTTFPKAYATNSCWTKPTSPWKFTRGPCWASLTTTSSTQADSRALRA